MVTESDRTIRSICRPVSISEQSPRLASKLPCCRRGKPDRTENRGPVDPLCRHGSHRFVSRVVDAPPIRVL